MTFEPMKAADFQKIIGNIKFAQHPTWEVKLSKNEEHFYLQIEDPVGVCNFTGEAFPWTGRKWQLSIWMCVTEVVRTVYKAYEAAVLHEMQESFRYKGVAIYDPHRNVELLVNLANDWSGAIDSRTERNPSI